MNAYIALRAKRNFDGSKYSKLVLVVVSTSSLDLRDDLGVLDGL